MNPEKFTAKLQQAISDAQSLAMTHNPQSNRTITSIIYFDSRAGQYCLFAIV